jgi:hypothetical protein
MSDVQYSDAIIHDPIKNLVRIPNQLRDSHIGTSLDPRSAFWRLGKPPNQLSNALLKCRRNGVSEYSAAISCECPLPHGANIQHSSAAKRAESRFDFVLGRNSTPVGLIDRRKLFRCGVIHASPSGLDAARILCKFFLIFFRPGLDLLEKLLRCWAHGSMYHKCLAKKLLRRYASITIFGAERPAVPRS